MSLSKAVPDQSVLLIVDVQSSFAPPEWLVREIRRVAKRCRTVATVERHDENQTPFLAQLGWAPKKDDESLVEADHTFVKHGYLPTRDTIDHIRSLRPARVFVCGMQAETCVLAAGFALFDAGLHPTLISDLIVGSSLDRSGRLGVSLWKHHFGGCVHSSELLPD